MAPTDRDPIRWPEKIPWIRRQLKDTGYAWVEANFDSIHLAYHPGGFLRVEVGWGPGSVFQHTLLSMQIQANWDPICNREVAVSKAFKALEAMGLVRQAEPPKLESP